MKERIFYSLKNIFLISLPSLLLIFLILELLSRMFFPGSLTPTYQWDEENKILKFDVDTKERGLSTFGNLSQQRALWRINNEGWNSPIDYFKEKGESSTRIAVIGDSYVEAFQVDAENAFPYKLNDYLGDSFEIFSFGKSGAPLSHYLHMARYVERNFNPDIYIFVLIHNDFDESIYSDNVDKRSFMTIKADSVLTEIEPEVYDHRISFFRSLLKKSSLIRFLKLNIGIEYVISDILSLHVNEQFEANTRTDEIERELKKIRAVSYYLFHQINKELEGKHVLFIMDAPRHNIYDNNLSDSRVLKLNKMVDSLSKELTFNFLDLTRPMEIDYQKNKTRFETKYDGHWNDYGHEFVAKTLYEYFVKKTNN